MSKETGIATVALLDWEERRSPTRETKCNERVLPAAGRPQSVPDIRHRHVIVNSTGDVVASDWIDFGLLSQCALSP